MKGLLRDLQQEIKALGGIPVNLLQGWKGLPVVPRTKTVRQSLLGLPDRR